MRLITREDIDRALSPSEWDFGNDVLYRLCREYPQHIQTDQIIAKVWLIGRSYAAAIERRPHPTEGGDEFYVSIVGPRIKNSCIDSWFKQLRSDDVPGCEASIEIHGKMLELFHGITEHNNWSLASKYLHFHFPSIFFLYDGRAAQAITHVAPHQDNNANVSDDVYKSFVRRCVWLRDHIYEVHGIHLTPRQIDKLLLAITDNELRSAQRG